MDFRLLKRPIVVALVASTVLLSAAYGGFTSRLWFSNNTTGASGTGAILCKPGDEIWLNFSFHGDATRPNKWTLLQVTFDLATSTIVSDADCNTWDTAIANSFKPSTTYSPVTPWQCSDGIMYDSAIDPSDSTQALVTTKGLYMLVGVFGTKAAAQNLDALGFFKFHIAAGAANGEKLDWLYPNRNTQNGLATMVWDNNNIHHLVTDNYILVDTRTASTTTLAAAPNPSTAGQSVTMTATVNPAAATGNVEFFDGATSLGTAPVVAGVATLAHTFNVLGAHSLNANYGGDTTYMPSSGTTTLQVNATSTTTTVTSDINPSKVNQAVNVTATVSPVPDGGTVQFKDGGTNLGSPVAVNTTTGLATLANTFTTAGTHALTAVFSGTTNFATSTSSPYNQVVNKATTTTSVVDVPNPSNVGVSVTITATVTPVPDGGQVQFKVDGVNLGSPVAVDGTGKASTTNTFNTAKTFAVEADYLGTANYDVSSNTTSQVVNPPATTTTLVASPNPADRNATVTLTATVSPVPDGGTVEFKDGATSLGTSSVNGSGVATLTHAFATAGAHNLTCHYSGTSNYGASDGSTTLTVNQTPTSTGLVAAPNPSTAGQSVTMTATVTPTPDGGTVEFFDGATSLGTASVNGSGVATLAKTFTTAATHSLSAVYSGTTNFATSTGTTSLVVNPATTTTTLTSDLNPSLAGQNVNLTATVSPVPDGGTVQFKDGANNLGAAVAVNTSTGKATLAQVFSVNGVHHLSAVYSGTSNYSGSTGTLDQTVNRNSSSTGVVDTANPSKVGDTVTITATVTPVPDGGTVQFKIDGVALGSPVSVNTGTGQASTTNKFTTAKSYTVSAEFSGSASFDPSTGSTTQVVNPADTTTTLAASPNPVDRNANTTLTATVTPVPDGGTVQFKDGATVIGSASVDGTGKATLSQAFANAGAHSLTCHFSGTSNYNGSDGSTTLNVNKTNTTTGLVAAPNPVDRNANTTLTATVTPTPDGGTVEFFDGATSLGTGSVNGSGVATLSKAFATAGPHALSANFSGTSNFGSSSGSTSLTVNKTGTGTGVTADINPSLVGQQVTFTATVTPVPDGGTVQFKENGTAFGSPVPVNTTTGIATIQKTFTSDGGRTISADYGGDTNFAASTGSMTQTVNKTPTTTTLVPAPNPSSVSQSVTLTATVAPVPDGGTVAFMDGATNLGSVAVNTSTGQAVKTVTFATAGTHSLAANYSGTTSYLASSGTATQTVNPAPTTTAVVGNPNPSNALQQVTLTATVTPVPDGGTVTFMDGATNLGTANVDGTGKATLNHTFNDVGPHSIVANYSGTPNYAPSSGSMTQTVNINPTTTTLTASPNPAQLNANVTLTAQVAPTPDGGSVTFKDGATTLGTAAVDGTGKATLTTTFSVLGSHNLEADYGGNAHFDKSSGTTTLTIVKITTQLVLTASPNPAKAGDTTALYADVSPNPGTGTVEFKDGGSSLGSASVDPATGRATISTVFATPGVHSLEADYSGNDTYATAVGTLQLNVKAAELCSEALPNLIVGTFGGNPVQGGRLYRPEVLNIDTVTLRQVLDCNGIKIDPNLIVQAVRVLKHTPWLKCNAFVYGPGSGLNTNFDTGVVHATVLDLDKSIEAVAFGGNGKKLLGNRALLFSPPGTTYSVSVIYVVRNPQTGRTGPPQTQELHWVVAINNRDDLRNNIDYFATVAAGATQKPKIDELPVAGLYDALNIPGDLDALIQFETVVATYDTDFSTLVNRPDARFFHGYLVDSDEEPIGCLLFEMVNALLWH